MHGRDSLGKDRTTLERNKITKAYIGKLLKVSGQVSDVTAYGRGAIGNGNYG
jgi:hypothetical protein